MTTAEKYVTAALIVVLALVLLWVAIYAFKVARLSREVSELAELVEAPEPSSALEDEERGTEHLPAAS